MLCIGPWFSILNTVVERDSHRFDIVIILLRNLTKGEAETYALVLSSSGIRSLVKDEGSEWIILVNQCDFPRAISEIEGYEEENVEFTPIPRSVGLETSR